LLPSLVPYSVCLLRACQACLQLPCAGPSAHQSCAASWQLADLKLTLPFSTDAPCRCCCHRRLAHLSSLPICRSLVETAPILASHLLPCSHSITCKPSLHSRTSQAWGSPVPCLTCHPLYSFWIPLVLLSRCLPLSCTGTAPPRLFLARSPPRHSAKKATVLNFAVRPCC